MADPTEQQERRRAFVRAYTRVQAPPGLPELRLHLGGEVTPLWQLTEAELDREGVDPPFWAFAWAGGQAVARYLLDTASEVSGLRVLDVASGSGLCALAAARAGAATVRAVDIDPFSVTAIGLNATLNDLDVQVACVDLLDDEPPDVDVVLAGDVCYERAMAQRFLAWLERASAAGARVLLGDPGRGYLPRDRLVRLAEYELPTTPEVEEAPLRVVGVYTLR
ncbi:MAG: nicotinamide N-methylase [Frankiales bacterium]|nr:nicotinamide N-methylase [Frankiales bacterium]